MYISASTELLKQDEIQIGVRSCPLCQYVHVTRVYPRRNTEPEKKSKKHVTTKAIPTIEAVASINQTDKIHQKFGVTA